MVQAVIFGIILNYEHDLLVTIVLILLCILLHGLVTRGSTGRGK